MNKVMVRTMIDKHIDMLMGLSEMAYSQAKEAGMSEITTASQNESRALIKPGPAAW